MIPAAIELVCKLGVSIRRRQWVTDIDARVHGRIRDIPNGLVPQELLQQHMQCSSVTLQLQDSNTI